MNFLSEEQLRKILTDNCSITLKGQTGLCNTIPLFAFNECECNWIINGFYVSFENSNINRRCRSFETLLKYLKKEKVITNGKIELISISDKWKTYDEYIEHINELEKFEKISMKELLLKYKHADTFSLTGTYNEGFSQEYPYGIYSIDDETGKKALEKIKNWELEALKKRYEAFSEEEKQKLPSFENLIIEIQKEYDEYLSLVETGKIPKGQNPFEKTKYSEPFGIMRFYNSLDFLNNHCKKSIYEMQKNIKFRKLDYIFDNPRYKKLKESLIETEVTFTWHCTTSGRLAVVYYFKINEISLNWLQNFKDDYDMYELDDLAFYQIMYA